MAEMGPLGGCLGSMATAPSCPCVSPRPSLAGAILGAFVTFLGMEDMPGVSRPLKDQHWAHSGCPGCHSSGQAAGGCGPGDSSGHAIHPPHPHPRAICRLTLSWAGLLAQKRQCLPCPWALQKVDSFGLRFLSGFGSQVPRLSPAREPPPASGSPRGGRLGSPGIGCRLLAPHAPRLLPPPMSQMGLLAGMCPATARGGGHPAASCGFGQGFRESALPRLPSSAEAKEAPGCEPQAAGRW